MDSYVTVIKCDGETFVSVKTRRELALRWEENDECGYLDEEIIAFQYNDATKQMEKVNVYEIAREYLRERDEIEQEYRDYCDLVNEYGYDYQ